MLTKAWQAIVDLVKPDAFICDYSPTALLALRDDKRPKIITGIGFSEPEAGHPIADWRHYNANDHLVAEQERVALHPINTVLEQLNKTPLQTLSELWQADRKILSNFHIFDPYHDVRTQTIYCLDQNTSNTYSSFVFRNSGRKRIIAYLKPSHPKLDQILQALTLSDADIFIACPMGPEHILKTYESDDFKYSTNLINLAEGLTQADLFICHGGSTSVKEAIIADTPIIVFPLQQEQLLTGKKLQELGAGMMILNFESPTTLSESINGALNDAELCKHIKSIKQTLKGSNQTVASAAKYCIAELLASSPDN
jgi:hypothetical protein